MPLQSSQKSCGKIVLVETEISLQLKYSVSRPVVVACQKDSGTTVEKWTQVKPVILTAIIFAVYSTFGGVPDRSYSICRQWLATRAQQHVTYH